ncbi:MAG: FMN-binding protein, partial [Clostridia bacterium]|nr:FMN-binding protein [Clostridia bacterium]
MKTVKNILISLLALAVACAVVFAVSYFTSDLRQDNIQKEHEYMMRLLLPGSVNFEFEPYAGNDESVLSVHKAENGYVVETAHQGYNGTLVMMVGVNNDGFVTGVVVRDMNETMGLGQN